MASKFPQELISALMFHVLDYLKTVKFPSYTSMRLMTALLSVVGFSGITGCTLFNGPVHPYIEDKQQEPDKTIFLLKHLDSFNLTLEQRQNLLETIETTLLVNTENNDEAETNLYRALLLIHPDASVSELEKAGNLLMEYGKKHYTKDEHAHQKVYLYLLKLQNAFMARLKEANSLQQKLDALNETIKSQRRRNQLLQNKIDALTEIEQRINLRSDNNL